MDARLNGLDETSVGNPIEEAARRYLQVCLPARARNGVRADPAATMSGYAA